MRIRRVCVVDGPQPETTAPQQQRLESRRGWGEPLFRNSLPTQPFGVIMNDYSTNSIYSRQW